MLLEDALQEVPSILLAAVRDHQAVIAAVGAGLNLGLPGISVIGAEEGVGLHAQLLGSSLEGVGPHLEDGGGAHQHDVSDLLAGHRGLGIVTAGGSGRLVAASSSGSGRSAGTAFAGSRGGCVAAAAGRESEHHSESKQQSSKLFHDFPPI